jgi:hypothetical protein
MSADVCRKRFCGCVLEFHTVEGRLVESCPWCDRKRRGLCRDCPRPVHGTVGKSLRCAPHAAEAQRERTRAWVRSHPEEARASSRRTYQKDEAARASRNEYKRQYRKLHPDKVRAQKRRYVEKHAANPNSWYVRYHARYNRRFGAHAREILDAKRVIAQAHAKVPRCRECGRSTRWTKIPGLSGKPWETCNRCAWPHQVRERKRVRRAALRRLVAAPTKPVKVRRPPRAAQRGPELERTCITPGCEIVVTGRKKKCTKCRRREAELAAAKLEEHHGRGRRTDLERVA